MNGLVHIADVFSRTKAEGRADLMPYFTLGYPTPAASLDVIEAITSAGADMVELGVPFSDPLADGSTIQHSTQVALENGVSVQKCFEWVKILRSRGVSQPMILMGYYNPILAYGPDRFVDTACSAGVDGLIVPDLPLEEAVPLESACQKHNLALIYLVAPTTPDSRLAQVTAHSTGFVYIVSLIGVTGARSSLSEVLQDFLRRARMVTTKPLAVGFGISTPEQARRVGKQADGVIVGSALINAVGNSEYPADAARRYVAELRNALLPKCDMAKL